MLPAEAPTLEAIRSPIAEPFERFQTELDDAFLCDVGLVGTVGAHLHRAYGKRFRPTLVLLAAKGFGRITDEAIFGAVVVELIHTATLIHDDSVDKSLLRRGLPTVNSAFNNDTAILMGDYLYSKAFSILVTKRMYEAMDLLADATHRMSQGELRQIEQKNRLDLSEQEYMRVIDEKTACLMSAGCELGANEGGADAKRRAALHRFGRALGLAFQITDDLMDYLGAEKVTGKAMGNDLDGGKITLPLINALREAPERDRREMEDLIRSRDFRNGHWSDVVRFVKVHGGVAYSQKTSARLADRAEEELDSIPNLEIRESLQSAVRYAVTRER
ncbi:MAG TPA: polyprenyl synthetase family protein [Methylomirabilota bacterium]|nr:polyprenyl synthetase family protein [Methylomirabilota bacterium]